MEDLSIRTLWAIPNERERKILEMRVNAMLGSLEEKEDDRYFILEDLFNEKLRHFRNKYALDPRRIQSTGYQASLAVFAAIERREYDDLYVFLMTAFPEESRSSSDSK